MLSFVEEGSISVQGNASEKQLVDVVVVRTQGCHGEVACKYRTENGSALGGHDFTPMEGELVFRDKETHKKIQLEILEKPDYE